MNINMKIDKRFSLKRYGLMVRLVNEEDAEYIVNLRSDPDLGKYLNNTPNDLEKQKEWIRDYKAREYLGLEYYFIFYFRNKRIGVIRIYNIKNKSATGGSWICTPNLPFELPILIVLIMREILFENMMLEIETMDTRKENKKVIKMHHLFGSQITGENEIDVFHVLTKEQFIKNKSKILRYVGLGKETTL